MGIRNTSTTPPPFDPKTKQGRTRREGTHYDFPLTADEDAALAKEMGVGLVWKI